MDSPLLAIAKVNVYHLRRVREKIHIFVNVRLSTEQKKKFLSQFRLTDVEFQRYTFETTDIPLLAITKLNVYQLRRVPEKFHN